MKSISYDHVRKTILNKQKTSKPLRLWMVDQCGLPFQKSERENGNIAGSMTHSAYIS